MKLKKQFEDVEIMFENQTGTLKYDELSETSNKCLIIARNFAIGFSDWLMINCDLLEDRSIYRYDSEDYTNEKLLEIYEKSL